jgi:uncharacterized protein
MARHLEFLRAFIPDTVSGWIAHQSGAEKKETAMSEKRDQSKGKEERGFAAMDEEKQREIARKGGEASHGGQGGSQGGSQGNQGGNQGSQGGQGGGNQGGSRGSQSGGQGSERGFAAMDEEKQREIAGKGGQAAHDKGSAHEFTSEEAREAGKKGGEARGGNQGGNQSGNQGGSRGGSQGGNQGGSRE